MMADLIEEIVKNVSPGTSQFNVLTYLAFKGPSHPIEISEEIGIPSGTVRPALRSLLEKDYVAQLDDGSYKSRIAFTEIVAHLYSFLPK